LLIAIFRAGSDSVNNETILKGADVSRSTWAVEQNNLIYMGLLDKKFTRSISKNNVFRTANYRLTAKGRAVAFNLLKISEILDSVGKGFSQEEVASKKLPSLGQFDFPDSPWSQSGDLELLAQIRECVEVALEGYGANFADDVRSVLESEFHVQWSRIPKRVDLLVLILRDFFGEAGAKTVETLVCKNLRSRFVLEKTGEPEDLQSLITELLYSATPVKRREGGEEKKMVAFPVGDNERQGSGERES
jgi:DNA-binding MarR family transcriptional regulator